MRIASLDDIGQIVVPENLQTKVLLLAHHTRLGGHPGDNTDVLRASKNILLA